jgi:alkylhydroperoxidase family enzyme
MEHYELTGMPFVSEAEAEGEVAELYANTKRMMQIPAVPHGLTLFGNSAPAMKFQLTVAGFMATEFTLPESLQAMIRFMIAERENCEYCSTVNELQCRMIGVDDDTLANVAADMGNVSPERLRAILEFCLKAAEHSKEIDRADFDSLREHGVSEGEILELVLVSAVAVANDIIADTLKTPVDPAVLEALGR